ncbi:MAG: hypothetical protein AAGF12_37130, partial [Myxococcota bacterium]
MALVFMKGTMMDRGIRCAVLVGLWLGGLSSSTLAQDAPVEAESDVLPTDEGSTEADTEGTSEVETPESESDDSPPPVSEPAQEPPPPVAPPPPPEVPEPPPEPTIEDNRDATIRTLETSEAPTPTFTFWEDGEDFIKPVIQLSATMVGYFPTAREGATDLAFRLSTLALARFGLEGELFGFLTFRSVFERNIGYSLARNGPVGTGVWEGTASLQPRENYLRIEQWGLSLTGGIFRDPASVDYISDNVLDNFGMDPYVRDPLLLTGFNQGQGVMLRYGFDFVEPNDAGPRARLTGGLSFTGGNPLTSSLAFSFGGDASSLGSLFTAPFRALSNGLPGSDIHMLMVSPSVSFESEYV